MELFKAAQRIPPRRIPVVRRYEALPAASGPVVPIAVRGTPRALATAGALLGVAVLTAGLYSLMDAETSPSGSTRSVRPTAAPLVTPSFRVIRQPETSGGGGGGGGGFGGPAAGPLVQEKATASVLTQLRKIIFTLKKDPSTKANMTDRMALFAKYFNSLTPSDRIALFGTIDFRQVEHALRAQGEKGPQALDRCLAQLQLILF